MFVQSSDEFNGTWWDAKRQEDRENEHPIHQRKRRFEIKKDYAWKRVCYSRAQKGVCFHVGYSVSTYPARNAASLLA